VTGLNGGRCLAVVGPTASGKSRMGMMLALRAEGEIVSADSRQLYRYMDIGTAKPSVEERACVVHHLVDILDPDEECSAGDFARLGRPVIDDILNRGKLPVIVGGSGLYIDGLAGKLFATDIETEDIRQHLKEEAADHHNLYKRLTVIDPAAAQKIHPHDEKRIIRALEVYRGAGEPISQMQKLCPDPSYTLQFFGLRWDRESLYQRIECRVDEMIEKGLVDEVRHLLARGYSSSLNAMDSIGYKEIIPVVQGHSELLDAVALLKRNTRRLAKKQITWFRRMDELCWVDIDSESDWDGICNQILGLYDTSF